MPTFVPDFVDHLERELDEARDRLARMFDRVEALAAFHAYAYDLAARLQKPLSADDVWQSARTEKERALIRSLADRISGDDPGGQPAYDDEGDEGTFLETGAGF